MLLKGLTVLDLSRIVAGPACTRTLADLGADVIKIEPPEGDIMRRGVPKVNGVALGYAQQNAGKRQVSIDLSKEAGRKLVTRLAAMSDILVENYRPGVTERLGIDYDAVAAVNEGIIYCSITGWGQTGPASVRRAFAPIIHAELGLVDQNARERGTDPLPEAVSHADFATASQAATGILAAYVHKLRTGQGQYIDVSMAETMLGFNEFTAVEVNGGFGDAISPFRPGKAALVKFPNGDWAQVPGNPTTWIFDIAKALDKESELHALGLYGREDTQGKDEQMVELLQRWADEYPDIESLELAMESSKLPLGKVKRVADIPKEPWAIERGAFVQININGAAASIPRSPFRLSHGKAGPAFGVYPQGYDNRSVMSSMLGLSDTEIDTLESEGVLCKFSNTGWSS
ncbi:MAG: CaiB/BaiF CoA-transferase family protein [Gammaproteobacteria bacterium]|nr:CaiB/BaiF CoA-transferase family protein [Gammaproteobacteria bacterium]